ncbi:bifunctional glutamate N-acetyltransferase/amino-acid acetyltransferase ArgJ [Lentibacillus salicampi]|uniref:Arginine biosynthesis bifunctional protein ArgJ n=1 Tax=Lentibacillus salicampi TaxID=175306 RepID=A0A4Y9AG07_9BACI|nr:bifunctional glutamate N-acetyltransferase/amino-acid acetyltransferase ArgJ [Lentibacillus salicampi]TFJ94365.1 bifunctional glutamate N-acetyltransferase/amino-acid acetyltransferase ArgJ [Lentibacillus salicampi]
MVLIKESSITKMEKGTIVTPAGFQASGMHTGVKRKRNDLGMIYCDVPASTAALYTLNIIQAAPLQVTKESIATEGKLQAVVVNSGNANACTGKRGEADAYTMRRAAADRLLLPEHMVAVSSTGIIGLDMPMDKIIPNIQILHLSTDEKAAAAFNESILTTDTGPKSTCHQAVIDGQTVTMAGSAKGSGMIEPKMGTMLAYVTTDAAIEPEMLQVALKEVTDKTFNCITIDGDTSTNDMVLTMASGKAGNESLTPAHSDWETFTELLQKTCEDLAKMIARDGEGATKLIEVEVDGAYDDAEAVKAAKTIVGSSLVKTAIYGADPNWGRIIAAVGRSGVNVNAETIDVSIGPIPLLENSQPLSFSEAEASDYLMHEEVVISVNLNNGNGCGKAWGCDLTYDYVRINASYRT